MAAGSAVLERLCERLQHAARIGDLCDMLYLLDFLQRNAHKYGLAQSADILTRLPFPRDENPLFTAVGAGQSGAVRLLLARLGCDIVDATKDNGQTALHWACAAGHVSLVHTLVVRANADVLATDAQGLAARDVVSSWCCAADLVPLDTPSQEIFAILDESARVRAAGWTVERHTRFPRKMQRRVVALLVLARAPAARIAALARASWLRALPNELLHIIFRMVCR